MTEPGRWNIRELAAHFFFWQCAGHEVIQSSSGLIQVYSGTFHANFSVHEVSRKRLVINASASEINWRAWRLDNSRVLIRHNQGLSIVIPSPWDCKEGAISICERRSSQMKLIKSDLWKSAERLWRSWKADISPLVNFASCKFHFLTTSPPHNFAFCTWLC